MKKKHILKTIGLTSMGLLSCIGLAACKKDEGYPTGTKVSDAYVDPKLIKEIKQEDIKAKGYEYDYENLTYDLIWSDEFEQDGLPDTTKWGYDIGGSGWGNNELQYYTEGDNAIIKDGNLIIEARKEEKEGKDFTSARLVSKNKGDWLYGKFEIRAKLPEGLGTWPAIWMLPTDSEYGHWPSSGEIDIMEHVGYDQDVVHASVHTKTYNHNINTQKTATRRTPGVSEEFHTYTLEWLPDKIMAYINGELYYIFEPTKLKKDPTYKEWPFDKKMHLILNLAVGGNWGGARGMDDSIYPRQMAVEYVRVYQSKEINELVGKQKSRLIRGL